MDCDKLIDEMLSCSGGTAEKQHYQGTAGDSLASPDRLFLRRARTGQSRQQPEAPDRVQNYRERLASVAAGEGGGGVKQGGMGYLLMEKHKP